MRVTTNEAVNNVVFQETLDVLYKLGYVGISNPLYMTPFKVSKKKFQNLTESILECCESVAVVSTNLKTFAVSPEYLMEMEMVKQMDHKILTVEISLEKGEKSE